MFFACDLLALLVRNLLALRTEFRRLQPNLNSRSRAEQLCFERAFADPQSSCGFLNGKAVQYPQLESTAQSWRQLDGMLTNDRPHLCYPVQLFRTSTAVFRVVNKERTLIVGCLGERDKTMPSPMPQLHSCRIDRNFHEPCRNVAFTF